MARLKWELHIGFVQHPQLLNSFLSSKKKYRIHTQIHSRQKHVCVDHWVLREGERGEEEIPASGFKALTWMPFIIELCLWMEDQEGSCCLSIGLMLLTDDSWHAFHCRGCLSVGFRVQARRLLGTIYGGRGGGGGCLRIWGGKMNPSPLCPATYFHQRKKLAQSSVWQGLSLAQAWPPGHSPLRAAVSRETSLCLCSSSHCTSPDRYDILSSKTFMCLLPRIPMAACHVPPLALPLYGGLMDLSPL